MNTVLGSEGEIRLLLGNEAIARGALEAGIQVATSYPGTPSTEILESIASIAKELGIYVEWSVNEKVALEVALGASILGLRALTSMKHVGLNVAADTFMSLGYSGTNGGLVIVSADDPECHSSQNEQDNRVYGLLSYIPVYEPSDQQEAKDLTRDLFIVSEKFKTGVLLRTTTRLSHSRGPVKLGSILKGNRSAKFLKEWRWTLLPINARRLKRRALDRIRELSKFHEQFKYNYVKLDGDEDFGIVTCGVPYLYVLDSLKMLRILDRVALLKLASVYPIPTRLIRNFVKSVNRVLIVEEVEPFLELQIRSIAPKDVEILGKDLVPRAGELNVDIVTNAIGSALKMELPQKEARLYAHINELKSKIPKRSPILCPGCPHRALFYSLKLALRELELTDRVIISGDIGCYTLGYFPPYRLIDTTICMGASIGLANGFSHFFEGLVIAVIGDSTFFHTGMSGLANAVYNKAPFLLIILDNSTTAMTGFQPHPGTGYTATLDRTKKLLVEKVLEGLGVGHIEVANPYNIKGTVEVIKRGIRYVLEEKEVAAIISRRPCVIYELRRRKMKYLSTVTFQVDYDKCNLCMTCISEFACPAIDFDGDKISIDMSLCTRCGVCVQVCPIGAIKPRRGG